MSQSGAEGGADAFDDSSAAPGVWRYARARRVRIVIDSADYFDLIQQAMLKARQRILLIGWDFDTRIHLSRGRRWYQKGFTREHPVRLGSFILWLNRHRPKLEIRILKWNYSVFSMLRRGSMLFDLLRWARHRRIDFKFDVAHPVGCCHHQKIVVIDDDLAVCGGIDMTGRRWDTREHKERDDRRRTPGGEPYGPWHDVTVMLEGEVAGALEELGRERWRRAGGKPLSVPEPDRGSAWPDGLAPHFEDVEVGIARTRAAHGNHREVTEIEALFVEQIAAARQFVYIENQYLTSRAIGEAIARRLVEADPPEIVIVHPESGDGWMEAAAMDPQRDELVHALRSLDEHERFHLYVPWSGTTPIYVHAKLTIIDDRTLRVGSANLNNRSMRLDSECDVFIDAGRPGNSHATPTIRAIRHSLLAEHCGLEEEDVRTFLERDASMAALIARAADTAGRHLRPYHPPDESDPGSDLATDLARRQVFDPAESDEVFAIPDREDGLFRPGSLLNEGKAGAASPDE